MLRKPRDFASCGASSGQNLGDPARASSETERVQFSRGIIAFSTIVASSGF
jgi:hypothetical protein